MNYTRMINAKHELAQELRPCLIEVGTHLNRLVNFNSARKDCYAQSALRPNTVDSDFSGTAPLG